MADEKKNLFDKETENVLRGATDVVGLHRNFHMDTTGITGGVLPPVPNRIADTNAFVRHLLTDCGASKVGDKYVTGSGKSWHIVPPYEPPPNRQCFFIGRDILDAIEPDEMIKTIIAMEELGIAKLPYPVVDLKFKADDLLTFFDKFGDEDPSTRFGREAVVLMVGVGSESPRLFLDIAGRTWADFTDYLHQHSQLSPLSNSPYGGRYVDFYRDVLIVTLATKGVEKTVKRNPMAAMRIGKSKASHVYTTTLKIRPDWYSKNAVSGVPRRGMRPHLRRGHVRHQHYGPKNEAVRKVWIQPVFVNADKDFVSVRSAYNMSKGEA
jgi:hypothetical protein